MSHLVTQPANPYLTTGYAGGFLELPAGTYSDDPHALAVLDPASPGGGPTVYLTTATPVLRGSNTTLSPPGAAMTYDAAFTRWLPVPAAAVSPDGTRYAYVDALPTSPLPTSRVHIVDVRTGMDHVDLFPGPDLAQATQSVAGVVGFRKQGVYLTLFGSRQGAGPDTGKLWLMDPDQGTVRKVTDLSGSWLVTDAYAWTLIPTPGGSSVPNRLVRQDLATGDLFQSWVDADYQPVSSPGAVTELSVIGLDPVGNPIVEGVGEVGPGSNYTLVVDVWVIKGPNQAVALDVSAANFGDANTPRVTSDGAETDSFGTWIALNDRLFFSSRDGTFQKVAAGPYSPAGSCE